MRHFTIASGLLSLFSIAIASSHSTTETTRVSKVTLPSSFKPPQVFKNTNLVHIISLEKNYAKESINVLIENIDSQPQDEYFLPFTPDQMSRIGGFEVKDRKDPNAGSFAVDAVEFDPLRYVEFSRLL
jgi:oligosaccharyltransferase complex subunit alpha (ribophorin I)